jgi:hypothetical protein
LQITEIEKENLTKLIKNSTQYEVVVRSAVSKQEPLQVIAPGESIYYAQCYPKSSTSELLVTIQNSEGHNCSMKVDLMIIKLDPMTYELGEKDLLLRSTVSFVGANTVLDLSTVRKDNFRTRLYGQASFKTMIQFTVSAVSLSFMRLPENKPRQELLNMVFSNLSGFFQINSESEITFDGVIEDIQIDNNSVENTNFPVVLKRGYNPAEERQPQQGKRFLSWHIVVENPLKSNHWYFSHLEVKVSKMELFVEEEYIDSLLNYKNNLLKSIMVETSIGAKDCITYKHYTDFRQLPSDYDISKKVWEVSELIPKNNFVFIESIFVSPIEIELSYYQDAKSTVDKDFEMFSLIGVIIGGFEEAQISLKMISTE